MFCGSLFVLFLMAIVLSVLLRFTDSDYHFGILKLFLNGIQKIVSWYEPSIPSSCIYIGLLIFIILIPSYRKYIDGQKLYLYHVEKGNTPNNGLSGTHQLVSSIFSQFTTRKTTIFLECPLSAYMCMSFCIDSCVMIKHTVVV